MEIFTTVGEYILKFLGSQIFGTLFTVFLIVIGGLVFKLISGNRKLVVKTDKDIQYINGPRQGFW